MYKAGNYSMSPKQVQTRAEQEREEIRALDTY